MGNSGTRTVGSGGVRDERDDLLDETNSVSTRLLLETAAQKRNLGLVLGQR